MKKTGIVMGLALLLGAMAWLGKGTWTSARVPDIALVTLAGDTYRLAPREGNPLLVVFWSTTCLQCLREVPDLVSLYRDLHPAGLDIVGITMPYDPPSNVVATTAGIGINYPVVLDVEGKVGNAFGGVIATPTTFLVAPDGRIVKQHTGATDMAALRKVIQDMIHQQTGSARNKGNMAGGSAT